MVVKHNIPPDGASFSKNPSQWENPASPVREQEILREILKTGKDSILVAEGGSGVFRQYLPQLFSTGRRERGDKVLLIVPSPEQVARLEEQVQELSRRQHRGGVQPPRVLTVGVEENPRKESRNLLNPRDVLVGTPERIIDHLRRDNIDLSHTAQVIIHSPGEEGIQDFTADVRFIYSRTGFKPQTLVVVPDKGGAYQELRTLLHRPRRFRLPRTGPFLRYYLAEDGHQVRILENILLANRERESRSFRIHWSGDREEVRGMLENHFPAIRKGSGGPKGDSGVRLEKASRRLGTPADRETIVYNTVPPQEVFAEIRRRLRDCEFPGHFIIIINERERAALLNAGENNKVEIEEREVPRNDTTVKDLLREVVKRIKKEEDPEELNYYRKLFTKNVSIFLRSYVAAYLIKEQFQGVGQKKKPGRSSSYTQPGMTTLFFGAGKNRGLSPRNISNLVTDHAAEVEPWEIGEMKILDKYSFVDVVEEKASLVIEAVNGVNFGGKKILVNYARKKKG